MAQGPNEDQVGFWNGPAGELWLRNEERLEVATREVTDRVLAEAGLVAGGHVLEIGCGSGGLALELAQTVGAEGEVLGLDLSAPMVARAQARARDAGLGQARFLVADAQVASLPRGAFDAVVSQFGAMFFSDPAAAFANLLVNLRPNGRLVVAAWGPVSENPFFALSREVGARLFGPWAIGPGDGPGPFAFADRDKVAGLLAAAGYVGVRVEPVGFGFRAPGGVAELADLATELGPAAGRMREVGGGEARRAKLRAAMAEAFAPFATSDGVRLPALVNLATARPA